MQQAISGEGRGRTSDGHWARPDNQLPLSELKKQTKAKKQTELREKPDNCPVEPDHVSGKRMMETGKWMKRDEGDGQEKDDR